MGANETSIGLGDGDGVVNLLSLQVCLNWRNEQSQPFNVTTFPGIDHAQIITDVVGAPMPSSTTVSAAASLTLMVGSTAMILALMLE